MFQFLNSLPQEAKLIFLTYSSMPIIIELGKKFENIIRIKIQSYVDIKNFQKMNLFSTSFYISKFQPKQFTFNFYLTFICTFTHKIKVIHYFLLIVLFKIIKQRANYFIFLFIFIQMKTYHRLLDNSIYFFQFY